MDKDVAVRLKYSSKYAQVANYWKYFIGQTEQLKNNKVADKKRAIEADFTKYATGKAEFNNVLNDIDNAYKTTNSIINLKVYQSEFVRQVDINALVYTYKMAVDAAKKGQTDRAKRMMEAAAEQGKSFFTERNMDIEIETLEEVLKMYIRDIPAEQRMGLTKELTVKSVPAFMARVKSYSVFADKKRFEDFLANYNEATLTNDPLFVLIKDLDAAYVTAMSDSKIKEANEKATRATRLFVKGVREMQPKKKFYPNANSTMRMTYGNVLPYTTNEGKYMDFITDFDGVVAKEDPKNPEFFLEKRMKDVWMAKDFGQYADKKTGKLPVNFLTNNDITGGNSGSPCINGNGELIGTAFDGNWEAMSGDIYFEPNLQRTIVCDIRYVLWIVDKCYGASNLIAEMNLVK